MTKPNETGVFEGTLAPKHDPVNHPSHYTSGKFEVMDIIEDQLGPEGARAFCLGNTIKYISRAGKKDPLAIKQDYEKARWYLNRAIEITERINAK